MLNVCRSTLFIHVWRSMPTMALAIIAVSVLTSSPARAADGLADVYQHIEAMRISRELCNEAKLSVVSEATFQQWAERNQVAQVEAMVRRRAEDNPKVGDLLESARLKMRRSLESKMPQICKAMAGAIDSDEFNPVRSNPEFYRTLKSSPEHADASKTAPSSSKNKGEKPSVKVSLISADMDKYLKKGGGPDWDEVEKVVLISSSNGFSLIFKPQLLFSNGDLYRDFDLALEDLDVDASRRARPKAWGSWKEQGDTYVFNIPGDAPWEVPQVYPVWPADKGAKLDGTWKAGSTMIMPSAELGMMDVIASAQTITFTRSGRFELNRSSGGSVASAGAGVSTYANAGAAGKYRLSEYALTLQFDDGRTERVSFYYFDSKGRKSSTVVGIAGVTFIKQDD
ncbi:hypothetical protein O5O45_27115 [Hahella aquimaris]|uniref:hypothetical protein n=1 Tax=Hahella sp. HNIBRBA332 TaxID=3015983 RepID=UPI00273ACDF8|nr:hypothetical protein [Hahella sp. HNIBRBA332]WLQ13400.1 hypothetical protein O5O45_27115 [Hahella sp. HNIBRBA332]